MNTQRRLTADEFRQLQQFYCAAPLPEPTGESSPILRELAAIERPLLEQLLQECNFDIGDILFQEDEAGDAMYIILSGKVVVLKGRFDSPTILGYRGAGEIVGEMALLENAPRSASVIALEPLRMLRISRENFTRLINSHPSIGMNIMATLSARLRGSDEVVNVATQTQKQLRQQVTQLRAEKAHLLEIQRVRQEVSDLIVHDLRNPLGVLYGVMDVLKMVLPEDVLRANQELLDIAGEARERMKRLIDSLLDIARMEEGRATLNLNPTALPQLIERVLKFMAFTARRRQIELQAHIPDALPRVALDEEKIERVLNNLLDNAFKYTPPGGAITIEVQLRDEQLQCSVTDTGSGIPESERQHIFERFTQVQGDTAASRRGFGLGLAFCKMAVEAHGGSIWVESGPDGVGARFVFTLPVTKS